MSLKTDRYYSFYISFYLCERKQFQSNTFTLKTPPKLHLLKETKITLRIIRSECKQMRKMYEAHKRNRKKREAHSGM